MASAKLQKVRLPGTLPAGNLRLFLGRVTTVLQQQADLPQPRHVTHPTASLGEVCRPLDELWIYRVEVMMPEERIDSFEQGLRQPAQTFSEVAALSQLRVGRR